MILGMLTLDELSFINNSLNNNKGIDTAEYEYIKKIHPYATHQETNPLISSTMKYYGKHDILLNNFLINKFTQNEYGIDFFYELIYNVGDYTQLHRDKYFVLQTTLVLLSDNFTGGNLIIDGSDVNFNQLGMYVNFSGNKKFHEVTKIESGQRRILAIMFNKKKELL